ncbi:S-layer homology domain-containing protein [Paenibacillus agaridevorans]
MSKRASSRGRGDNRFAPGATVTRAEAVTLILSII